jgi:ribosome-associated protein
VIELESVALAHKIVDILTDKQAEDILLLDLHTLTLIADYFIICTATSDRHTKALLDTLDEELKPQGARAIAMEGQIGTGWLLADYGSVIVHIFGAEERAYYQLEQLWHDEPVVLKVM